MILLGNAKLMLREVENTLSPSHVTLVKSLTSYNRTKNALFLPVIFQRHTVSNNRSIYTGGENPVNNLFYHLADVINCALL